MCMVTSFLNTINSRKKENTTNIKIKMPSFFCNGNGTSLILNIIKWYALPIQIIIQKIISIFSLRNYQRCL